MSFSWSFPKADLLRSILFLGLLFIILTSLAGDGNCRLVAGDLCEAMGAYTQGEHPHTPSVAHLPFPADRLVPPSVILICLVSLTHTSLTRNLLDPPPRLR